MSRHGIHSAAAELPGRGVRLTFGAIASAFQTKCENVTISGLGVPHRLSILSQKTETQMSAARGGNEVLWALYRHSVLFFVLFFLSPTRFAPLPASSSARIITEKGLPLQVLSGGWLGCESA